MMTMEEVKKAISENKMFMVSECRMGEWTEPELMSARLVAYKIRHCEWNTGRGWWCNYDFEIVK